MKIVEPSVELVDDIDGSAILKKIELCGRVCYQSQPKGDPSSFVRMLLKRGHESVLEHVSLTFHIICDRAIMAELTRHRLASFSVESTRYIKYRELEVVAPFDGNNPFLNDAYQSWETCVGLNENFYRAFINGKYSAEKVRAILPLCLKSELYMTANLREWRHILRLRTAKAAHPQMRLIANQILQIFKEKIPIIVEDF